MKYAFLLFSLLTFSSLSAQTGKIIGKVVDQLNNDPVPFSNIYVQGTDYGTVTDSMGSFELNLDPGLYNLEFSFIGYRTSVLYSKSVSNSAPVYLTIELERAQTSLPVVSVLAQQGSFSAHYTDKIGAYEIVSLPGATMDLSKYIKVLPGVSPKVSFGYNMIVRGGASNENRFFLDDIEIPSITHFAVQGNAGGPNGILNSRILESAELFTDAMPASRSNALSSVMEISSRLGTKEKFTGNFTLGATDWGFVLEGPMGKKSSYVFSARESFSQHMLKAIGLPVLPFYADVHYAQEISFNEKTSLRLLGIGVYDKYTLNLEADPSPSLLYNTGYIPEGKQLSYTTGAVLKRFHSRGVNKFIISQNYFENRADKFYDNTYEEADRMIDYRSVEASTKLRYERSIQKDLRNIEYGVSLSNERILSSNFSPSLDAERAIFIKDYESEVDYFRYGLFYKTDWTLGEENRFLIDFGLRLDGSTYNEKMANPLRQLSPRAGVKYKYSEQLDFRINSGIYFQEPSAVLLSYSDGNQLVNESSLKYIRSNHLSISSHYSNYKNLQGRISLFVKDYSNYPMLLLDGISSANANANYVLVGDQPADASSEGLCYGAEFFAKKKYTGGWSWLTSMSYVVSRFSNMDGELSSSAWDNRFFVNAHLSKRFKNNWTIGARWVGAGGNPYTPYDLERSAQFAYWDTFRRGIADYSRLNEARLPFYHQMDLRVDKQFDFRSWTFTFYLDIQNVYKSEINQIPYLSTVFNEESWTAVPDPTNTSSYLLEQLSSDSGRMLPTLGLFFDF